MKFGSRRAGAEEFGFPFILRYGIDATLPMIEQFFAPMRAHDQKLGSMRDTIIFNQGGLMGNCVSGNGGVRSSRASGRDGYESDVDTRNKQRESSRASFPDESLSDLKPLAKKVYEDSVLWHGTASEHVPSLRRNGFKKELKNGGATSGGTENFLMNFSSGGVSASAEHHYLSSSRDTAKYFAMHTDSYQPALVRTIGVSNNIPLEKDPYTDDPAALRTLNSIPAAHVLGSKNSPPGADAAVFRDEMRMAGHNVSTEQAGQLLREVQSDSDNDSFPDIEEFIMKKLRG